MMGLFATIAENAKALGAVLTCCTATAGGYVYLDGPIPATKQYVIAQAETLKAQNEKLNGRVIDQQLQLNTVQRNLLRKEKFDRDIEITKDQPPTTRSMLQQRLDQIHDELDTIEKEREALRKEKTAR